ncbi:MAG TPA: hypothetical protein PKA95_04455 [Thermomicrobiales bacterium]|nr:hypothetical protein [Thermomicrobiales bacterium]
MPSPRALIATATLAATLTAGTPLASAAPVAQSHARAPRPAERAAIAKVSLATIPQAERARFRVIGIRVSTLSRWWAKSVVTPRPKFRTRYEGAYLILVRSAASNQWTVLDIGTSGVGCLIAPFRVLVDLGVGGECAPRERL